MKLSKAKKLIASIERSSANEKIYDKIVGWINDVETGNKSELSLRSVEESIKDCIRLDNLAIETENCKEIAKEKYIKELGEAVEELKKAIDGDDKKKSRAADMAKSRAKASFLRDVRLTDKAEKNLVALCETLNMNKTQVINKLLEEQEQLTLL